MLKEELIECEIRKYHKQMMINYMVEVIIIHLRISGKCNSMNVIYDSCRDTIEYNNRELNHIFNNVRSKLKNNIEEFDAIDDVVINQEDVELDEIENIKRLINSKKSKQKEVMNLFMSEKIDYDKFKYMSDELDKIIKNNEQTLAKLQACYNNKPVTIEKSKISKYIVDHWSNMTNKEKYEFLNQFVESIIIVNRDGDRYNGKAEVVDVKFYDFKQVA